MDRRTVCCTGLVLATEIGKRGRIRIPVPLLTKEESVAEILEEEKLWTPPGSGGE